MFNYQNLEARQFEELCRDILQEITGVKLHVFARGRDRGVDLTDDSNAHNIIVQVKHYQNSGFAGLKRDLQKEVSKVNKLCPRTYYVCVSQILTDSNINEIYLMFSKYMKSTSNIITLDDIDNFLHRPENIHITRNHTKLWLESGITLQLLGECFPKVSKELTTKQEERDAITYLKARILQQKKEHPSFRLLANAQSGNADSSLFPDAIQQSERYMTYHDKYDKESDPVKLSDFIAQSWENGIYRHLQIQGIGGIGKTVTLLSISTEPGFLPYEVPAVYIPLYELNGYSEDNGIEEYIRKNIPKHYEIIDYLSAEPWTNGPRLLLLLDGFNEIALKDRRVKVWREVREWAGRSGVQIITTSRFYSGFTEDKFIPITLQKISEDGIITYLSRYNKLHNTNIIIPEKGDALLRILVIPLMLTLYLQIEGIRHSQKAYPYLEFRNSNNSGNLIRNFIQKEILNYSEYVRGVNIGVFVYSMTAILPYIMYQMEGKGLFSLSEQDLKNLIAESVDYYNSNPFCIPEQVLKARRGKPLNNNEITKEEIFSNIIEKSGILVPFTGNDNIDVYRPMHQDFRDCLAALYLCNIGLGYSKNNHTLPKEYTISQRNSVVRFASELLHQHEFKLIWDVNRLHAPTNISSTKLLLDIIGRKTGYDYNGINFSNMDLTNISLYSFLDNHPGLPRNSGMFNNTKLSEYTFLPIGHTQAVDCVETTIEGDTIISGSFDKTIRVWNLETGNCKYILKGHIGSIRAVAVSHNGKIISGSDDKTLRLYDLETGSFIKEFSGHMGVVKSVAISHDGLWAISGSFDRTVRIWELNKPFREYEFRKHIYRVTSLSLYEYKSLIVSGDEGGSICIWNFEKKSFIRQINCGNSRIIGAYIFDEGRKVIVGTSNGNISVWGIAEGNFIRNVNHNIKGHFSYLRISPDEKYIILGAYHWNTYLLDINSGDCKHLFGRHTNIISGATICQNGNYLISSSWDRTIRIWDMYTGECVHTLGQQINRLMSTSMSYDGNYIASCFRNGTINIWNARKGVCEKTLKKEDSSIVDISVDKEGKHLVSCSWNGVVRLYDLANNESTTLYDISSSGIGEVYNRFEAVSISANGEYVLSGNHDGSLFLWDTKASSVFQLPQKHANRVADVSIDSEGKKGVSVDWNGVLFIWDLKEHTLKKIIENSTDNPTSVMINHSGELIVTGSYKRLISLFDVRIIENTHCICRIGDNKQHTGRVNSIAVSADGKTIVSGSREKYMSVWNSEDRKRVFRPQKHKGRVTAVSISADGCSAVSGDSKDTIRVWNLQSNTCTYEIRPFVDYDLIGVDFRGAIFDSEDLRERCRQNGAIVSDCS